MKMLGLDAKQGKWRGVVHSKKNEKSKKNPKNPKKIKKTVKKIQRFF
jgi:hypothetical protein